MKKESLIAVVLGLSFGLLTSIVFLSSSNKNPKKGTEIKNLTQPTILITPKQIKPQTTTFVVNYPQDNLITNQKDIQIQAVAPKDSLILVQMANNEKILKNKNTKFTVNLSLNYGANQITIFVYPKNIQLPLFKKLTIYYLENKL
mgnify:FL=1